MTVDEAQEIVESYVAEARERYVKRRKSDWWDYEHCKRKFAEMSLSCEEYEAACRAVAEALHL